MRRRAIVTLVTGDNYLRRFRRYCYDDWKAYADRHDLDIVIAEKLPDVSSRGLSRSAAWQKCLVMTGDQARGYEQVVWIDADILINAAIAPNIFESVRPHEIGAVEDYAYPTREAYQARLQSLYERWSEQGVPFVENLTPEAFLQSWGLPPMSRVIQTGVLVVNPELHRPILWRTYTSYEDKGSPDWSYEMRPLSYEIVRNVAVRRLDLRFNVVVCFALANEELDVYFESPGWNERVARRLRLNLSPMFFARNRHLANIYRRLMNGSFFLHFAGRQQDMALLGP